MIMGVVFFAVPEIMAELMSSVRGHPGKFFGRHHLAVNSMKVFAPKGGKTNLAETDVRRYPFVCFKNGIIPVKAGALFKSALIVFPSFGIHVTSPAQVGP